MIARAITLAAGLTGAAASSQFPEFSQQYVQRLGGAVDALAQVVTDFDASAQAEGMTRNEALSQMTGTAFVERRRADMVATFARYEKLSDDLARVRRAGPFMRAYHGAALGDAEIARATWAQFKPALPLTFAGLIFAGAGFVVGTFGVWLIRALPRLIFRPVGKGA